MIIYIGLQYKNTDVNSDDADLVIQELTTSCEKIRYNFNADACWIGDALNSPDE